MLTRAIELAVSAMNTYWLSRNGSSAEGLFAEEQLLEMWRTGSVTARDQVCLDGSDDWEAMPSFVAGIQSFQASMAPKRREPNSESTHNRGPQKNAGTVAVLNFLLPGVGHIYAGEVGAGALVFLLTGAFSAWGFSAYAQGMNGILPLGMAILLWLVALTDSSTAVKRAARRR
jgi:hypothetical protein